MAALYVEFVEKYSRKMWDIPSNKEITDFGWTPKEVALQTGSKVAWEEAFSGFPTISMDMTNILKLLQRSRCKFKYLY